MGKLNQICDLAEEHNAFVIVDECHGTGVLGQKGRGSVEELNVLNRVHMISNTFGKALGCSNGGVLTGKKDLIDQIK